MAITFDENAHSPISYNTIIVMAHIFYKFKNVFQTFVIFTLGIFFVVVITIRTNTKLLT